MSVVSMKALLETGVHFGHRAKKWDPRMKPFIFTERNGIHIIDLQQTLTSHRRSIRTGARYRCNGGSRILFVGTKRQAQETIQQEAERCAHALREPALAGRHADQLAHHQPRIDQLKRSKRERESGEFNLSPRKKLLIRDRMIEKLKSVWAACTT